MKGEQINRFALEMRYLFHIFAIYYIVAFAFLGTNPPPTSGRKEKKMFELNKP